jgi:ABC-type multidrug transport system fused ATPase/permease subunit
MNNFLKNLIFILSKLSKKEKILIILFIFSSLYLVALEALTFSSLFEMFSNDNNSNFFIKKIYDFFGVYFSEYNDLLIFFLVFSLLLRNISYLTYQFLISKFTYNLYARNSKLLLESYFQIDFLDYLKYSKATYMKNIIKESYLVYLGIIYAIIICTSDFLYLVTLCLFAIFYLQIEFSLFYIFIFIFFFISYFSFIKFIKNLGRVRESSEKGIYEFCSEILSSIVEIKIYKKSALLCKNFFNQMSDYAKSMAYINTLNIFPKNFLEILIASIICILYIISDNQDKFFNNNAYYVSLGFILYRIVPSISKIFNHFNTIIVNYPSMQIFQNMYNERLKERNFQDITNNLFQEINLLNVNFSIKEKKLIDNFSYKFKKGNIYCIKGKSGSGKTSLIYALLGLYKFNSGKFTIDNIEIKNEILWGEKIGYVSQFPIILDLTLADNLFIDDIKNLSAEEKNYFFDFGIEKIILNSSEVDKSGLRNLSGGEKQRLSIVKALLRKPKVLIMDEPFSSLDYKNSLIVIQKLKQLKKDSIIILSSHEDIFDDQFDKIIKLN